MEAALTGGLSGTVICGDLSPQTERTATVSAASAIVASEVGPRVLLHPGQAKEQ